MTHFRAGPMCAHIDALVAMRTLVLVPYDFIVGVERQSIFRAPLDTIPAVITIVNRMGIMAVNAVKIASL